MFVSPKPLKKYKDVALHQNSLDVDRSMKSPSSSEQLVRSVSSPAQRSYGYEIEDSTYSRPISSPITYRMESPYKGFSSLRKRSFAERPNLDGCTGPHGLMVKIGDFKKSILVNEGSLQAGVIAPSPQKVKNSTIPT